MGEGITIVLTVEGLGFVNTTELKHSVKTVEGRVYVNTTERKQHVKNAGGRKYASTTEGNHNVLTVMATNTNVSFVIVSLVLLVI